MVQAVEAFDAEPVAEEQEFDLSGLDGISQEGPALTESQQEFAEELEALTSQNSEEHLRMTTGSCRRVAEAMRPVLAKGWKPKVLAGRLAAELNPKVHTPERLLISKASDFGAPPPEADPKSGKTMIKGKLVDLGSYDMGFGYGAPAPEPAPAQPNVPPAQTDEGTRERLARLARKSMRY